MKRRYKIILYTLLLASFIGSVGWFTLLWLIPYVFAKQLPWYLTAKKIIVLPFEKILQLQEVKLTGEGSCANQTLVEVKQLNLKVNPAKILVTAVALEQIVIYGEKLQLCNLPTENQILPTYDDIMAWHSLPVSLNQGTVFINSQESFQLTDITGSLKLKYHKETFVLEDIQLNAKDNYQGQHFLAGSVVLPQNHKAESLVAKLALESRYPNLVKLLNNFSLPLKLTQGSATVFSNINIENNWLNLSLSFHFRNLKLESSSLALPAHLLPLLEDAPGIHTLSLRYQSHLAQLPKNLASHLEKEFANAVRHKINLKIKQWKKSLKSFRELLPLF